MFTPNRELRKRYGRVVRENDNPHDVAMHALPQDDVAHAIVNAQNTLGRRGTSERKGFEPETVFNMQTQGLVHAKRATDFRALGFTQPQAILIPRTAEERTDDAPASGIVGGSEHTVHPANVVAAHRGTRNNYPSYSSNRNSARGHVAATEAETRPRMQMHRRKNNARVTRSDRWGFSAPPVNDQTVFPNHPDVLKTNDILAARQQEAMADDRWGFTTPYPMTFQEPRFYPSRDASADKLLMEHAMRVAPDHSSAVMERMLVHSAGTTAQPLGARQGIMREMAKGMTYFRDEHMIPRVIPKGGV
jgi:hypothetical protein